MNRVRITKKIKKSTYQDGYIAGKKEAEIEYHKGIAVRENIAVLESV